MREMHLVTRQNDPAPPWTTERQSACPLRALLPETTAYTIRSPSASTLASPVPLDQAMIHDNVN